jgi:hypothetical protein
MEQAATGSAAPEQAAERLAEAPDALDDIQRDFPAWHVWISAAGRWWATRTGKIAATHDRDPDFAMTVDADTSAGLREALTFQQRRFGSAPT